MQSVINHKNTTSPELTTLHQLLSQELKVLDALILKELHSEVSLINEITEHIVKSGGKRLRPILVILMAQALGYQGDAEHLELAAIIEFIHTATLLHDDVVDASTLRRNQPTANATFGNEASVLSGDFLYSRAFQLLAKRSNIPVMKIIANATNRIAEGEVLQLINAGKKDITEQDYFTVIERKTAELYSTASQIGAMIATQNDPEKCVLAATFGTRLGLSFQLIDDLLDYVANPEKTGKNLGDDLAQGKLTLPLIYTLQHANEKHKKVILNAIDKKGDAPLDEVIHVITTSKGCDYTFTYAKQEAAAAKKCLSGFPDSPYREALSQLCDFVLLREY